MTARNPFCSSCNDTGSIACPCGADGSPRPASAPGGESTAQNSEAGLTAASEAAILRLSGLVDYDYLRARSGMVEFLHAVADAVVYLRGYRGRLQAAWEKSDQKNAEHRQGWTHLAFRLIDAGYRGDGVTDGVEWLLGRLALAEGEASKMKAAFVEGLRGRARELATTGADPSPPDFDEDGLSYTFAARLFREYADALEAEPTPAIRPHHLAWSGTEWTDERCGCRYHPDDDNGSHGGAPHVHLCKQHALALVATKLEEIGT
jgi:hypothetical protein